MTGNPVRSGAGLDRARWHVRAGAGVVVWMVAAIVVVAAHGRVPASGWLLVHLVLLGVATNAILVWSAHFAEALLGRRTGTRRGQAWRLVALNVGIAVLVAGMLSRTWSLTLTGTIVVGGTVAAHGIALALELHRASPARFGGTVHHYVAGALLLPFGAGLGALLAHGTPADWQDRLVLAHLAVNLLGFVGLTVIGTLVTLWATMLRTRIVEGAERRAKIALVWLVLGIGVVVVGSLTGIRPLAALGLATYLVGLGIATVPLVAEARRRPPKTFATRSVLAAGLWFVGSLVTLTVGVALAPTWQAAQERTAMVALPLAAGFAAQVVVGALTYLVPVVLGGGPAVMRRTGRVMERLGPVRLVVVNVALLVAVLPTPDRVRAVMSALVVTGLGAFLVLLWMAHRSAARGDTEAPGPRQAERLEAARLKGARRVPRHRG